MNRRILCFFFIFSVVFGYNEDYSIEGDDLGIPPNTIGAPSLMEMAERFVFGETEENYLKTKCYCTDGACDRGENKTCTKKEKAACYYAIKKVHSKERAQIETDHLFGCLALEKGSDASHFACHSHKVPHSTPFSIACCYEGNWCNQDIKPPPFAHENNSAPLDGTEENFVFNNNRRYWILFIGIFLAILIAVLVVAYFIKIIWFKKEKHPAEDDIENKVLLEDSGSGSSGIPLNQRTVAQNLQIIDTIGRGRYGEVRKAKYKGRYVAVKTFNTTDEESWKNEREVYQTQMLNHENILQYVAADICSVNSITQMLLITDYHELGSLSDYLRREQNLSEKEALNLAHSSLCGLEHLHSAVHGTGGRKKPEIAHRDLKSKNIIVKRPGVCCLADFGLAVRFEGRLLPEKVKVQVGTKRYMAPEVLAKTLIPGSFEQFKMADMYSIALVLWEITRRIEWPHSNERIVRSEGSDSGYSDSSGSTQSRSHMQKDSWDNSAKSYVPPFEGTVGSDPTIEEMKNVVVDKGQRPPIDESWINGENRTVGILTNLMQACWSADPLCRYSALKTKIQLSKAVDEFLEIETLLNKKESDQERHFSTSIKIQNEIEPKSPPPIPVMPKKTLENVS